MKIAVLHYHLRPSGVTTAIRNELRALRGRFDARVMADFGYNDAPARSRAAFMAESRVLAEQLEIALDDTDALHAHNLVLGKNPRLACAVKLLVEKTRVKLINQVHDFAEENRPAQLRALRYCTGKRDDTFWRRMCYFDAPNVLWATLTAHDADKLAARGVPSKKIRVLPNPIDDELFARARFPRTAAHEVAGRIAEYARQHRYNFDPRRKLLLSPMKMMVRKNNAEAVELVKRLNALHGRDKYQLLITLDAASAKDHRYSENLKRKIRRERLPVVIGFGRELESPLPLFHLAHAILTTSRVEGFGYVFVEGWLTRKLVFGRDIPEVTSDFATAGMDLSHLYRDLDGRTVARLDSLLAAPPRKLIEHNRATVLKQYSLTAYARRFKALLRLLA